MSSFRCDGEEAEEAEEVAENDRVGSKYFVVFDRFGGADFGVRSAAAESETETAAQGDPTAELIFADDFAQMRSPSVSFRFDCCAVSSFASFSSLGSPGEEVEGVGEEAEGTSSKSPPVPFFEMIDERYLFR